MVGKPLKAVNGGVEQCQDTVTTRIISQNVHYMDLHHGGRLSLSALSHCTKAFADMSFAAAHPHRFAFCGMY